MIPAVILLPANRQRRFVVMSDHVSLLLAFVPLSFAAAVPMVSLVVDGSPNEDREVLSAVRPSTI